MKSLDALIEEAKTNVIENATCVESSYIYCKLVNEKRQRAERTPVRLTVARYQTEKNAAKLRRAKRLYARFCYQAVINDPRKVYSISAKAIDRGIFAKSAWPQNVMRSFLFEFYSIETGEKNYSQDWHKWLLMRGFISDYAYKNVTKRVIRISA